MTGVTGTVLELLSVKTGMCTCADVGSTLIGLTGLPSWSIAVSGDLLVDREAVGLDHDGRLGCDDGVDDRRRSGHRDGLGVDGRRPDLDAGGRRAAIHGHRHGPRAELIELDGHHVRFARQDPDPLVGGGHDDRGGLRPGARLDAG